MTGTGGFVIEAVMVGRKAIALDLEQEMVDGAMKNVLWALSSEEVTDPSRIQIIKGDATDLRNSVPSNWHQISFDPDQRNHCSPKQNNHKHTKTK